MLAVLVVFTSIFVSPSFIYANDEGPRAVEPYECVGLMNGLHHFQNRRAMSPSELRNKLGLHDFLDKQQLIELEGLFSAFDKHAWVTSLTGDEVFEALFLAEKEMPKSWAEQMLAESREGRRAHALNELGRGAMGLGFAVAIVLASHFTPVYLQETLWKTCTDAACVLGAATGIGYFLWKFLRFANSSPITMSEHVIENQRKALIKNFALDNVTDDVETAFKRKKPFSARLKLQMSEKTFVVLYGRKNDEALTPYLILGVNDQVVQVPVSYP